MLTTPDFKMRKQQGRKISMVTCYDAWSAKIIEQTEVDCVLVGDSLAMVMLGYDSTLPANDDIMAYHTAAVRRGAPKKFVVADLAFMSYRKDLTSAVNAVEKVMRAGANAVKLEGAKGNLTLIQHLVESGVPVMAHLGLTPQSIHQLGGFKVQGRNNEGYQELVSEAQQVAKAGAFALVLECVPAELAKVISESIDIPTIGIGAGVGTDGQVLVLQDMLGLNTEFKPKFLRHYLDGFNLVKQALNDYHQDVVSQQFPTEKESYL